MCVCLHTPLGVLLQSLSEAVASSDTTGPEKREKMLKTNEKRERNGKQSIIHTVLWCFFFSFSKYYMSLLPLCWQNWLGGDS